MYVNVHVNILAALRGQHKHNIAITMRAELDNNYIIPFSNHIFVIM